MPTGRCHCGGVSWTLDELPKSVTACSCTICRRYGVLWAYGYLDRDIHVSGRTAAYRRAEFGAIDFHFCPTCGCVTHYLATKPGDDGRYRTAVNLRMADPGPIEDLPIEHFDGLDSWRKLPRDGRRIRDMWF